MDYQYKSNFKNFIIKNSKNISIAILIVVIIFVFIGVSSFLTGYVSYNEELKKNLSSYELNFVIVNQTLNTCKSDMETFKTNLQSCEKQKAEAVNYSSTVKNNLDMCLADKTAIQANYTSMERGYKNIMKAAVQTKCCSYDDVWTGTIKNWNLADGKIVCSGNYTVNCTSGETSY